MKADALAKFAEAARCRVFGHEDAGNGPQREVLAALIRGFDHPDATVLCEPSLARKTTRPPDCVLIDPVAGVHVVEVKVELQRLASETGLRIAVCHFPPGTSKWNKIEHRMFCHISRNWRGRPLTSQEAVVSLIGSTTTATGLRIQAQVDDNPYPTGIKVSDEQMRAVQIERAEFHGEWNYTISPRED